MEKNVHQPAVQRILGSQLSKEWIAEQFEKLALSAKESNAGSCSMNLKWGNPYDVSPDQYSPMLTLSVREGEAA